MVQAGIAANMYILVWQYVEQGNYGIRSRYLPRPFSAAQTAICVRELSRSFDRMLAT